MQQTKNNKSSNWIVLFLSILIYFISVTTIYILVSLLIVPNPWSISWIIWPIAFGVFLISFLMYFFIKNGVKNKKNLFLFIVISTILLCVTIYLLISFLIPNIWSLSWLVFMGMTIILAIETIVYIKKN